MRLLLALAIAVLPQLARAQALELACAGQGTPAGAEASAGAAEPLRLKIDTDGRAQVQLPPSLLPKWSTGGPRSWRKVDGFLLTDTQISGRYRFDVIHAGSFVIDRRTGAVAVSARAGAFNGACETTATGPGMVKF